MSLTFVTGNMRPSLTGVIHEEGDPTALINLTGCTVRFQMRKSDDKRFTVNAAASVVDAAGGEVRYDWAANDLNVPGTYLVQWEVTFPDNKTQTTAEPVEIEVRRA